MVYYGVISICAMLFGANFFFNQVFQKEYGNDLQAMLVLSTFGALAGTITLFCISGFHLACTSFALLMSLLVTLNSLGFSFCSLKAFDKINLSLYSVLSMLGGMALPFVVGILFFHEPLTFGKSICFLCIIAALAITVDKRSNRSGFRYYAGIFLLNGMSGVLATIYQLVPLPKVSSSEYSTLCAIVTLIASLLLLLVMKRDKRPFSIKALISSGGNGMLNRFANFLLLICLAHLPASAQYPFITGGTMIVSTVISAITGQKPSKRELISVGISFIGLLLLIYLP